MGYLKYIRDIWRQPKTSLLWKERLMQWRREPATIRIEHPTRIDRAKALGYRAKQGYIIIRQRLLRGGRQRPKIRAGRRPKHFRRRKIVSKSYRSIAEERAVKKYPNLEVLNSYWVGQDGNYYWYEIILIDKYHPSILADKRIAWIAEKQHTRRVFRGLTSAAKKSRGLRRKGK